MFGGRVIGPADASERPPEFTTLRRNRQRPRPGARGGAVIE